MSVRVTDTRVVITEADSITGWTGGDQSGTPFWCEAPQAIQSSLVINENAQIYYTDATSRNVSASLIYVYSFNNALQNSWLDTLPPNALLLGDGTNQVSFRMAGADRRVFNHLDGPTEWQCLVVDGSKVAAMNTAGLTVTPAGTYAGFLANISTLTEFGADVTAQSKALGGGYNVGVDIIRFGHHGLRITSGSSVDPGSFLQIVVEDRSTASLKAHGIIREYTSGIYGAQGPLTFGSQSATFPTYFSDANVSLVFENRNINNDKYYLKVTGSATADTTFILRNSSITTAGPYVYCNFSGSGAIDYIRKLELTGNAFSNLGNKIDFANNYSSSFHIATNNTFNKCGIIEAGNVIFTDNSISNSTNKSGSLLLNSGSKSNTYSNLSFAKTDGTAGHAIYITAPASYSFNNFTYDGFGADSSTTASVYNNSGGYVYITITGGGDNPTVRNGVSATTELSNPKFLKLTGMVSGTEVTIVSGSDAIELFHVESIVPEGGQSYGSASYSYNYVPNTIVDILVFEVSKDPNLSSIFNYTLLSTDATIPVQQIADRIYKNP